MRVDRLSKFPPYNHATELEEIDSAELSPARFRTEYVLRSRPVVIRGLAKEWVQKLDFSVSKLRKRLQATPEAEPLRLPVFRTPTREATTITEFKAFVAAGKTGPLIDYADFLDEIESDSDEYLQLRGAPCNGPLAFFGEDLSFCERVLSRAQVDQGSRLYPKSRVFLYRNGYSDWHWHQTDETLTVQIHGTKELNCIVPDQRVFAAMAEIDRDLLCDASSPSLESIPLQRAVLQPGDALYLPVYWWHAAQGPGVGATMAFTFRTPLHMIFDLRTAGARSTVRNFILPDWRMWMMLPLVALGTAYAALRRVVRPQG